MRNGFLKSMAALIAGAGLALAQPPAVSAGGNIARISFQEGGEASPAPAGEDIAAPRTLQAQPVVTEAGPQAAPAMGGGMLVDGDGGLVEGGGMVDGGGPDGGPGSRLWFRGEYLMWWLKGMQTPPLLTTAPGAPNGGTGAVLGAPGTVILAGGGTVDTDLYSGGRFTIGAWLDCDRTLGIEGSYFFLGTQSHTVSASGDGSDSSPIIGRPFTDTTTGAPNSEIISAPGLLAGTGTVKTSTSLQGFNLDTLCNVCCGCYGRVDLIGGFRYLQLDDKVGIGEHIVVLPTIPAALGFPFNPGNVIDVHDQFNTTNRFYGGELGARAELVRGRFFVDLLGKVALGVTHESVDITGNSVITTPAGQVTVLRGGLLALSDNIGHYTQNRFAVVPEVGLNVGYQVTDHIRALVGYSFIYWSRVARAGDQIDTRINPTFVPTSIPFGAAPTGAGRTVSIHDSDFWAQGINFGIELDY